MSVMNNLFSHDQQICQYIYTLTDAHNITCGSMLKVSINQYNSYCICTVNKNMINRGGVFQYVCLRLLIFLTIYPVKLKFGMNLNVI